MSESNSFDPAEYVKRFKVHSAEFAAHHNEVISHIGARCPVFHAHMESFSPAEIDVKVIGGYEAIMATARDPEILTSKAPPEMFEAAKAGLISLNLPISSTHRWRSNTAASSIRSSIPARPRPSSRR